MSEEPPLDGALRGALLRFGRALWSRRVAVGQTAVFLAITLTARSRISELSGGVLWVPASWRAAAQGLLVALGLCVFWYARGRSVRARAQQTAPPEPPVRGKRKKNGKAAARRDGGASTGAAQGSTPVRRGSLASVFWMAMTLSALLALWTLGNQRLVPIHMTIPAAVGQYLDGYTLDDLEDEDKRARTLATLDAHLSRLRSPEYLKREGDECSGTLMLPFGFPSTAAELAFRDQVMAEIDPEQPWIRFSADQRFERFVECLAASPSLHWTNLAFVILHLLVVILGSIAFGYTLSYASALLGLAD